MLRELRIRNFAIVDDLTIGFRAGLNVITGETGAGKSIILQALALLCGSRAAPDLIRHDAADAAIEGLFDCPVIQDVLEAVGIADDDELLVRRQIPRAGKGRIFINGSPTTVGLLARLGEHLVHIYGQRDQALLLQPASHLEFLDCFGELTAREQMAAAFAELTAARQRLAAIDRRRETEQQRRELLEFQVQEIEAADVQDDEEARLRREREVVRNAERLQQLCRAGEATLYSSEAATVGHLARLETQLSDVVDIAPPLTTPTELIESARVQLEEAALQLRAYADRLHFDPDRLDVIEQRLGLLSRLSRKYGVGTAALPVTLAKLRDDLASLDATTADRDKAQRAVNVHDAEAMRVARELSTARCATARRLEELMARELGKLGMEDATFRIAHHTAVDDGTPDKLGPSGLDTVEFHLSANPGEGPRPLARVASGGELSRIMLALKTLTASASETPILIFDEVDAGIGGIVADAVARRLRALADTRQLLCITHLPQIAAYADHHFAVEKHRRGGRTIASARILTSDERVRELSRMLGGTAAPAEAERYARRLIAQGRRKTGRD